MSDTQPVSIKGLIEKLEKLQKHMSDDELPFIDKHRIESLTSLVFFMIKKLKEKDNNLELHIECRTEFLLALNTLFSEKAENKDFLAFQGLLIKECIDNDYTTELMSAINYNDMMEYYTNVSRENREFISGYRNDAQRALEEIKKYKQEADLLTTKNALSGFRTLYETLRKSQQCATHLWLLATFGMFVVCLSVLYSFYQNNKEIDPSIHIPFLLIFSEISITLFLIIITAWCAKMYSISKSLCISYSHKSVSSTALLPFMRGIDDDEIKDTVLLEASRMIFASPDMGLSKDSKLDLKMLETIKDINPIVKHVIDSSPTGSGNKTG